jgi:uncharacterized protein
MRGADAMATKGEVHVHPAMELRISGLSDGEYPFKFVVPAGDIGADSFIGDVVVEGTLRKFTNQLLVSGTAMGTHVTECDRCLTELQQEITTPVNLYYRATGEGAVAEESDDIDMRWFHAEQESIALDDEVRQSLLLALPLKSICEENCQGLCPSCGIDLNREQCNCNQPVIDPRWEKLAEIFKPNENN